MKGGGNSDGVIAKVAFTICSFNLYMVAVLYF